MGNRGVSHRWHGNRQKEKVMRPIAVATRGSDVVMWFDTNSNDVSRLSCISDEHAKELVAALHVAFGIRTKENSFTSGLLHRDLDVICSL